MLHRIIQSWMRSVHYMLVIAFFFSSVAPLQAQPIRQRSVNPKRAARSAAVVEGIRYSIDWINQQIQSVSLPQWARRRIVNTLRRFANPTMQERAVITQYVQGQPMSAAEMEVWKKFRNRALFSNRAKIVMGTIIVAILGSLGVYIATRPAAVAPAISSSIPAGIPSPDDDDRDVPLPGGAVVERIPGAGAFVFPEYKKGDRVVYEGQRWLVKATHDDETLTLESVDKATQDVSGVDPSKVILEAPAEQPRRTRRRRRQTVRQEEPVKELVRDISSEPAAQEVEGEAAASGAVELASLQEKASELPEVIAAELELEIARQELAALEKELRMMQDEDVIAAETQAELQSRRVRRYGAAPLTPEAQSIQDRLNELARERQRAAETIADLGLQRNAAQKRIREAEKVLRQAKMQNM